MKTVVITVAMVFWSTLAWGLELEYGTPLKRLNGVRASVAKVIDSECWRRFYSESLCLQNGLIIAQFEIEGGKTVHFLGGATYAKFRTGPFWNRIGFGFGLFDKKTEEVRTGWDFNLSSQYGVMVSDVLGLTFEWQHFSNGRSFAERLGLDRYWPDHNDGGNAFLIGVVFRW